MENLDWISDFQNADERAPREDMSGETVYTLARIDFLRMPAVSFSELIEIDPDLRALLN